MLASSGERRAGGRLRKARLYDLVAGVPLALWFAVGIVGSLYRIPVSLDLSRDGLATCTQLANVVLLAIMIVLLLVRRPPVRRTSGFWPRAAGVAGAVAPIFMLIVPHSEVAPAVVTLSLVLIFIGTATAIVATCWLGRAFSILPQARALVTEGPYRYVRHPLYLAEIIALCGTSMEFAQPWSSLVMLAAIALQVPRMHYEEQILTESFPSFRAYVNRTARLIPGVY